mgnify:CR=1 FL=1
MLNKLNCTILPLYLFIQKRNRTYDLISLKLLDMKMTIFILNQINIKYEIYYMRSVENIWKRLKMKKREAENH